ncbi:MAG: aspartate--tRNA(Asn) ligase [Clostridiales bacterium]|nr:aspartate--tRNA(Asn) ligase [Clostridiales bacterium]
MERTLIKEIFKGLECKVTIYGWVHKIRDLGNITFLIIRDRSGMIQVVVDGKLKTDLRLEYVVKITGMPVRNDKAPGNMEIDCEAIEVISDTEYEMIPLQINREDIDSGIEAILDNRVLSLRNPKIHSIFNVQQEIASCFRDFFKSNGFTEIQTPKIVSEGTEGGSELFPVKYFGRRVYLAQSPQFYKQMMVAAGYERVFEIGHAYRAELHNTARHLNEYVSLDAEMGFIKDENDIMNIENEFLEYLFSTISKTCESELNLYGISLPKIGRIPRMTLQDARGIIKDKYGKSSPQGNIDTEGEVLICRYIKEKTGNDFVFLTKYPVKKRPVYAMPDPKNPDVTNSFDLLYDGLEITTGGQRIHKYRMLYENMKKFHLDPEKFGFYLDTFKYGVPPHGGFAIGLERLTLKILKLTNIREASLFPRDMERVAP